MQVPVRFQSSRRPSFSEEVDRFERPWSQEWIGRDEKRYGGVFVGVKPRQTIGDGDACHSILKSDPVTLYVRKVLFNV